MDNKMEVLFAIPFLLLPLLMPLITGTMAVGYGRKFWPWFFLAIPLPFIANIILLCLDDKRAKKEAVTDEEIFDPIIRSKVIKTKKHDHEVYFSAKA